MAAWCHADIYRMTLPCWHTITVLLQQHWSIMRCSSLFVCFWSVCGLFGLFACAMVSPLDTCRYQRSRSYNAGALSSPTC
jgi:hypothetical protein